MSIDKSIDNLINHTDLSVIQEFRGKHLQPMIELKDSIIQELKKLEIEPVFVSARLKMITTILDKIKTGRCKKASTMQDWGGVRVVLKNTEDLDKLYQHLLQYKSFTIIRTKDYIKEPKETGYHGIHIVYKIDGRYIELQLRTELQHIWASTVETVGWYLNQDLKSGNGCLNHLEFFRESANLLNKDIRCNNIDWVRECKIDNVNGIEFLKSIHKDYSMSDCERMDINQPNLNQPSFLGRILAGAGITPNVVTRWLYSEGIPPLEGHFKNRVMQVFDNNNCILITIDMCSMKLIPFSEDILKNAVISFNSVSEGYRTYITREMMGFDNRAKTLPMSPEKYENYCSLFLYISDAAKLEEAYPCFFSQTKQFTDYLARFQSIE